jgi:excisionase family DNA binding protein
MQMQSAERNDLLLTVEQVAARLQISKPTVYRLIANGQLPALQLAGPGSTLRISERELHEWLFGASGRNGRG